MAVSVAGSVAKRVGQTGHAGYNVNGVEYSKYNKILLNYIVEEQKKNYKNHARDCSRPI